MKIVKGMIAKQIAKPYNRISKKYNLKPAKDIGEITYKNYNLTPISKSMSHLKGKEYKFEDDIYANPFVVFFYMVKMIYVCYNLRIKLGFIRIIK